MTDGRGHAAGEPASSLGDICAARDHTDTRRRTGVVAVSDIDNDTIMVRLAGAIDGHLTADLRTVLVGVLLRRRPRQLVLDLRQVSRVDPLGAGTIVAGCHVAEDCGIELIVDLPNPDLTIQLRQAGLTPAPGPSA